MMLGRHITLNDMESVVFIAYIINFSQKKNQLPILKERIVNNYTEEQLKLFVVT